MKTGFTVKYIHLQQRKVHRIPNKFYILLCYIVSNIQMILLTYQIWKLEVRKGKTPWDFPLFTSQSRSHACNPARLINDVFTVKCTTAASREQFSSPLKTKPRKRKRKIEQSSVFFPWRQQDTLHKLRFDPLQNSNFQLTRVTDYARLQ